MLINTDTFTFSYINHNIFQTIFSMIQPHGSHSRNPRWELVAPEMDNKKTCESHQGQGQGVWSGSMFNGWWLYTVNNC